MEPNDPSALSLSDDMNSSTRLNRFSGRVITKDVLVNRVENRSWQYTSQTCVCFPTFFSLFTFYFFFPPFYLFCFLQFCVPRNMCSYRTHQTDDNKKISLSTNTYSCCYCFFFSFFFFLLEIHDIQSEAESPSWAFFLFLFCSSHTRQENNNKRKSRKCVWIYHFAFDFTTMKCVLYTIAIAISWWTTLLLRCRIVSVWMCFGCWKRRFENGKTVGSHKSGSNEG